MVWFNTLMLIIVYLLYLDLRDREKQIKNNNRSIESLEKAFDNHMEYIYKQLHELKQKGRKMDINYDVNDGKGYCPKCKKEVTNYKVIKLDGECIGYPFECNCGYNGTEWYNLVFTEITEDI